MAHFEVKSRRVIMDNKGNDKSVTEAFFIENCTSCGYIWEFIQ